MGEYAIQTGLSIPFFCFGRDFCNIFRFPLYFYCPCPPFSGFSIFSEPCSGLYIAGPAEREPQAPHRTVTVTCLMMEALSRLTARTVIVAVPFRFAVSFPVEDTVTTFLLELLYRIRLVAFAGVSFGYSCLVLPFFNVYARIFNS